MLVGKVSDMLFVGGTMNNFGGEDFDIIVENGFIYCLGMDGFQFYSFGKM